MSRHMTECESWLDSLPGIDLHCHLDGSIPLTTLRRLCSKRGIALPSEEKEFLRMVQAPEHCASLKEYLKAFELPLACLQKEEDFFEAARDTVCAAADEKIRYLELRFAPLLSETECLSAEAITEAVLAGIRRAEKEKKISCGLILCAMRHFSDQENIRTLELVKRYRSHGVCALDLAGDESSFPNGEFEMLFRRAAKEDIPFLIHSGECGREENIRLAAEWGAARIGHGIAMRGNPRQQEIIAKKGIGVELCPGSNLQTKAVANPHLYPLNEYLRSGILVSVNTDNRTVTGTTIKEELIRLHDWCGMTKEKARRLMLQAVKTSFAEESVKADFRKEIL